MKTIISLLLLLGLGVSTASAQEISNIKGNRALVNSVPPGTAPGDRFVVRDSNGKAKALVEVKQVKGTKAVVQILKGRPAKGQALTPFRNRVGVAGAKGGRSNGSWGGLLGYSMDSMTVKPANQTSISMTGSSIDLSAYYQTVIDGSFGARILGGYETLTVSGSNGTTLCDSSMDCSVDIGYLGLQGLLTYTFVDNSSINFWAGAGLGFLYAMQKESNAIKVDKLSTNQTILLSLGLDYKMSPTLFIPVQFDYAIFPDTNTSSATQMNFRVGVGFPF